MSTDLTLVFQIAFIGDDDDGEVVLVLDTCAYISVYYVDGVERRRGATVLTEDLLMESTDFVE